MVVVLPQLPDWEPVGVGDGVGVALGGAEGVALGVAAGVGVEPQVPEASGDCTIVSVSMSASSVMRIVMPPSEGLPQAGEETVTPEHLFKGSAHPLPSMFVVRSSMLDWQMICTGWPSAIWMVSRLQACQSTVIVLVVPTGAPVRSSVVELVGLPPLTLSTVQSSVVWLPMAPTCVLMRKSVG